MTKPTKPITDAQERIAAMCDRIKGILLEKNARYGNSAIEPLGVLCPDGDALMQIGVRLEDKLKRIKTMGGLATVLRSQAPDGEDTVTDTVGYYVLALVRADMEREGTVE